MSAFTFNGHLELRRDILRDARDQYTRMLESPLATDAEKALNLMRRAECQMMLNELEEAR